ncbi:MAG TPA: NAD(P)H-dependent oxidoreductase subunit E [Bacteroidales bacterium]|nr:NAD(P)H-dependent oxidoreductase subunit E [Bacteroidales bacterium]HPT01899.1 NAD(P)H-dependent oxidoreductase subunit E [Bacteroidales bacterium]
MPVSIEDICSKYKQGSREALLSVLQEIQDNFGYLSEEAIIYVGRHLKLPSSKVYGIATFYDQFRFAPKGRYHLQVCSGTTCHIEGSMALLREIDKLLKIKDGQVSRDGLFSLQVVNCMGACSAAPVIAVNGEFHTLMSSADLAGLFDEIRKNA